MPLPSRVGQTTLSGRLRSEASSILPLDSSYGTVTSLTIARTGSPMLLINDEYDIFDLCQEILPPVPVLPPEKAYIPPPQNWFPLSSYSFCGETKMDRMWGNGYTAMVLSPTSRSGPARSR